MEKFDILNRDEYVEKLVNLINNISDSKMSTCFALNGAWGCGKSFVLDMLEHVLEESISQETYSNKCLVMRYNCWKYDYYEEPLVAIVAAMIDIINHKTLLLGDERKRAYVIGVLKTVGATLLNIVNDGIKEKIGVDIKAAYEPIADGIAAEKVIVEKSHDYDVYFSFNKTLQSLQDLLRELSSNQTIIFMVDELDRCLPEYAIKVLERLHHLTENSSNIITILSMDKEPLKTSIKQIFGFDNPEKYLEKFIKFEVKLDCGTVSAKFVEKHKDFFELFDKDKLSFDESIEEFFQQVFQGIDVREQEQLIHRAFIAHKLLFDNTKDYSILCVEILIVILKSKYGGCKKFAKWFDEINKTTYSGEIKPPFDSHFSEHFSKCINRSVSYIKNNGYQKHDTKIFEICRQNSLYAYILYLWYQLKLKNDAFDLSIRDDKQKMVLDDNLNDLQNLLKQ